MEYIGRINFNILALHQRCEVHSTETTDNFMQFAVSRYQPKLQFLNFTCRSNLIKLAKNG